MVKSPRLNGIHNKTRAGTKPAPGGLPAWFMPLDNRLQKFANALQMAFIAFRPLTSLSYKFLWPLVRAGIARRPLKWPDTCGQAAAGLCWHGLPA
jgi:hypothetical protein